MTEPFGSVADPGLRELAAVALAAAEAAAEIQTAGVGRHLDIDTKSSATDMVSDIDRRAEEAVVAILTERRPDDGILGEEGASRDGTSGLRWVVDPLDGTTNYLFGIPQFSVSIAVEDQAAGTTLAGIVVDPSKTETWAAVAGGGARGNGRPIHVATGRSEPATALIATGFGYRAERRAHQGLVASRLLPLVRDIRRFGSAALDLSWVAAGRVDAYYEWGLNPWDLAAGRLICDEAGGRTGVLDGRVIVAAVPPLYDPLVELLVEAGATDVEPGPEPRHW